MELLWSLNLGFWSFHPPRLPSRPDKDKFKKCLRGEDESACRLIFRSLYWPGFSGRRGSQVVRQGSAKAPFVGSIPTLASNSKWLDHKDLQIPETPSASESASDFRARRPSGRYPLTTRQPLSDTRDSPPAARVANTPRATRNSSGSGRNAEPMKSRFILYRRKRGGMFYLEDTETRKQQSLGTRNHPEALALLNARNESVRQPQLNLHIARTYLAASDPAATQRTWAVPLEELATSKQGATEDRWRSVLKDSAFDLIRDLPLLETRPEHLLKVMEVGTVSTNVFLRRVHNFTVDMGWLPWPVIPKKHWPKIHFREKRAITAAEHQAILARQTNPVWHAFYQLCWLVGASQSDVAFLSAEDVDWEMRVIGFARKKTKTVSLIHFDEEVEAVLKALPASGPLFPSRRKMNSGHRATEFTRICRRIGIKGVTLHSYRYAWAERAKQCGYPERFAQEALGHNSKAVHRAYSRKAKVKLPSLASYEKQQTATQIILLPPPPLPHDQPSTELHGQNAQ